MPNIVPDSKTAANVVHVSVAVIVNDGKVLIAKRADHAHQGGLWEFPGGKVEVNETIDTALHREVLEELGIDIKSSRPLISVLHHYPDKSVLLETRLVTVFAGREYDQTKAHSGLEGQEVKWVDIQKLANYQFPAANKAILNAVQLPERYAITPDIVASDHMSPGIPDSDLTNIEQFIQAFAQTTQQQHLIQLRIKSLDREQLNQVARRACALAQENHARVLLNSAMPLSDEIKQLANGIHLTSEHLHDRHFIACYQKQYPEKIIAASCHNRQDILRANKLKLDFMVISPVQHTASHPQQAPLGWAQFQVLSDLATVPVFALGGMTEKDIALAQEHGAQGIAAIRSLWANNRAKGESPGF